MVWFAVAEIDGQTESCPPKNRKMSAKALQYEIDQLKLVSARLDSLATQHPLSESAILSVSAHVLNNALLLQVLLATRIKTGLGPPPRRQFQS
jgi:hypothetical protein